MIENHVFGEILISCRYFNLRRGAIFGFFWWISKTSNGVAVSQTNMNCQAGSIALAKHVYIVFWVPLNATISSIDFTVKSYDFIDDLYHSAKPVWQNKVKKNTGSYRGFIPLLIHIIL